jgi:excisionase family DNA binding protein
VTDFVTQEQAAVLLGVSVDTVRRSVRAGLLRRVPGTHRVRFHIEDVAKLKLARSVESRPLGDLTNEEIVAAFKAKRARRTAAQSRRSLKVLLDDLLSTPAPQHVNGAP